MSSIFAATSFILIGLLLKQLLSRIRYFDMSTFVHVIIVIFAFAICLVGSSYYRLDMCINQILPLIPNIYYCSGWYINDHFVINNYV